jgi:hypothetical protein
LAIDHSTFPRLPIACSASSVRSAGSSFNASRSARLAAADLLL